MSRAHRGVRLGLAAALAAAGAAPGWAQYVGRVNTQQQNGTHLRATAVLEYTGNDLIDMKQSRLIPIAIWDGMQYQPGGLYLAQPAPLAVLSGTQYELQNAGKPEGFFNIRDAEDLGGQWIGVGKYEAPPPPRPRALPSRRNHVYAVQDVDPDKPHFAHRPPADDQQPAAGAPNPASASKSAPPIDPDRPTLHSRDDSAASSGSGSPSGQGDTDPDRPTFHRRTETSSQATVAQPPVDPDRPLLQYKAPVQQEKLDKAEALFGVPKEMNQVAGVSDASNNPDRLSWQFSWANPDDEAKMKAALELIAEKAIAPPLPATPVPAKTGSKANRRKSPLPQAPALPMLADEEFRAFSLSFGGGATMVFSARSAGTPEKYVTIIAAPDFYGNPRVLLQHVTSDAQLDVSPRYRLVDAVDTQGNGRADLIFELRGRTYRQFAIYRIADGTATQAFATQPTASTQAVAAQAAQAARPE
ncbi:MAG: hypothetical protein ACLGXA_05715 [Acidobacteriota bacterium]